MEDYEEEVEQKKLWGESALFLLFISTLVVSLGPTILTINNRKKMPELYTEGYMILGATKIDTRYCHSHCMCLL